MTALSGEGEGGFPSNCVRQAAFPVGSLSRSVAGCLAGPAAPCCPVQVPRPRFTSLGNNHIHHVTVPIQKAAVALSLASAGGAAAAPADGAGLGRGRTLLITSLEADNLARG